MLVKKDFTHKFPTGAVLVTLVVITALIMGGCSPAKQAKIYNLALMSHCPLSQPYTNGVLI